MPLQKRAIGWLKRQRLSVIRQRPGPVEVQRASQETPDGIAAGQLRIKIERTSHGLLSGLAESSIAGLV
jgi:hypothetical protein